LQPIGQDDGQARLEWRGDFFASDYAGLVGRLARFPEIARPFRHTLTVFLAKAPSADFTVEPVIRVRAYADLHDLTEGSLEAWLRLAPRGKLQVKYGCGAQEHGPVTWLAAPGGLPRCSFDGAEYVPASLRVTSRRHFAMTSDGHPALMGECLEQHRMTLDSERHLFRVRGDGTLAYLGDMGPRLEVKTPAPGAVAAALAAVNAGEEARVVPWRGLELIFQSFLRDVVARESIVANRELELKFDLADEIGADTLLACLQVRGELLLPFPHRIERLRRYHICRHRKGAVGEYTIVETTAGRLSQKRKQASGRHGAVIARRTEAMFTTDRDGRTCSVEAFCGDNTLVRLNSFTKSQTKVPFRLANGHAYQISLDRCRDLAGRRLGQLEIEYIGNARGGPTPTAEIAAELEDLGRDLRASPFGGQLTPSMHSKHAFFRAPQAPSFHAAMTADMKA
jgi:hypothetical protein